jgi:hypothetical protein
VSDHLDIIAKILAKAERTNHEAEREMLFARAQTLSTRHSIDLALARQHTAKAEQREVPEERTVVIGQSRTKGLARLVRLFLNIAEVNDVKCLISGDSTVVYAYGFPSDIEVVEALYASLSVQMVHAATQYIRSGAHKSETVFVPGKYKWVECGEDDIYGEERWSSARQEYVYGKHVWVDGEEKPISGHTARQNFYVGFVNRISHRLRIARLDAVNDAEEAEIAERGPVAEIASAGVQSAPEPTNLPTSVALALVEKSTAVDEFFESEKKRQRVRGSWGGERRSNRNSTLAAGARAAGDRAGRNAHLSSSKQIGN